MNARKIAAAAAGIAAIAAVQTARVPADGQPPALSIASCAFLADHWRAGGEKGSIEEVWMAPEHGTMVGAFRMVMGGKLAVAEICMINETPEGVFLSLAHFGEKLQPWKQGTVTFKLTEAAENSATFENPQHDHPKKIRYALSGDALTVTLSSPERAKDESFRFQRKG